MRRQNPLTRKTLVAAVGFIMVSCQDSLVHAHRRMPFPPPQVTHDSVRGRVLVKNGLLRNVYRERWGGGIQPAGAMVLTNLFNNLALLGTSYLTGTPQSAGPGTTSEGDLVSESGQLPDEVHDERMKVLHTIEKRADATLQRLGIVLPQESKEDRSSNGSFQAK